MFKKFRGLFSNDLSVDLGTANTLIYINGQGIVLNEPSVVAVKEHGNKRTIAAVGLEAKPMLGRTPDNITTIRPLKDGVIADFYITEKMLQYFIQKVHSNSFIRPSPRVLICVPCKATMVERRAIKESALGAGAREVFLIQEPLAAAIGAGLPFDEPNGSMVLDIGGGTTEIAIMTLGGAIYAESVRIGGDLFDEAIISFIRRKFGVLIGLQTAERVKVEIGTAFPDANSIRETDIRGNVVAEGIPTSVTVTSNDMFEALQEPMIRLVHEVRVALEKAPPELAADIAESGIVLTGGGALLHNLDKLISTETGLPVICAEDPLTCVARGGGIALDLINSSNSFQLMFSDE